MLAMLAGGCVTPAGQIPDSDFTWAEAEIPATLPEIEKRFFYGFRACEAGVPECLRDDARGTLLCDIYISGEGQARRTGWVLGRIRVTAQGAGTSRMRAGIQHVYLASRDKTVPHWFAFARDDVASCAK